MVRLTKNLFGFRRVGDPCSRFECFKLHGCPCLVVDLCPCSFGKDTGHGSSSNHLKSCPNLRRRSGQPYAPDFKSLLQPGGVIKDECSLQQTAGGQPLDRAFPLY